MRHRALMSGPIRSRSRRSKAQVAMGLGRISLCCVFILSSDGACVAQGWPFWGSDFDRPPRGYERSPQRGETKKRDRDRRPRSLSAVHDGGARPVIAPKAPAMVAFPHGFPVNTIVIDTRRRKLYFVFEEGHAYEYSISVGREGFRWTGTEVVSNKQEWPDWYPPAEMRARDASLPKKMTGGVRNPLGAIALYLGNSQYRIHGTNDVKSIGHAQSSGCFRMLNSEVLHLATLADIGTRVVVVDSLPSGKKPAALQRNS
jgi:lipoprotein-anchoring transpeptidase ErfK/SrfK